MNPLDGDALLARVLDRFPNGSVNIFDRDLRYLYAGGEGLAATGLSSSALVGKRLHDLFTPESVKVVEPFYRRALAGESVRFDLPVFDRVYSVSAAPYVFDDDKVTSIIAVAQDITDAKRTEAALAESEARLQLALEVAGVSTWELDVRSGAVHLSESVYELLGLENGDLSLTLDGFLHVVHPEDRAQLDEAMKSSIASGSRYAADFRIVRPDGAVRSLLVRGETFRDDDGAPTRMLGAMIDVTVQREMEEKLRRIYRSKDDLLAVLGHELRQPVQAAVVALGVMEAKPGEEAGQRARQVLGRQLLQMSRLVDELIYAARVVRSEAPLQRTTFDLVESIHTAVETTNAGFGERNRISLALPATPVLIHADQQRIQQVLLNLIGNAVKYTPEGGSVDVQLMTDADAVLIRVSDTGHGIDPEHLPHIFDLFTRGERDVSGLGVGLAVVRRIVEQHGGDVSAFSEGKGRGAEFTVRLPAMTSR